MKPSRAKNAHAVVAVVVVTAVAAAVVVAVATGVEAVVVDAVAAAVVVAVATVVEAAVVVAAAGSRIGRFWDSPIRIEKPDRKSFSRGRASGPFSFEAETNARFGCR
jgi:hypothetical protein